MRCPQCGHDNGAELKFCGECGTRLGLLCAECGARNAPSQKFCGECGARLTTRTPSRTPSPESYTPKHLAERILTSKAALEGERKQVTVLFADLKGSMELLADRDPEEARKILDPVLEHMMEAVHRYEGTVNQVMGDGIMALFGAPIAHEDHAIRACYAALRMQNSIKRYAEGVRRVQGVPIRIRVGLNSGEVVVRAIGSDLHMDYTAVGQTTHLAARMEQLAEPGTALLTPATHALCEDFVQVKSLGPMRVKGLAEPLEAYELTGANSVRSRFHAHAARGLTKFVGRASEMAQLGDALDLARKGRGQVVAVVGEPGVGKSRLFWEFTHSHRTAGCLVLEAASVSYGKATTYFPVIELLHSYFEIEPRDDVRKIREKVTGKLLSLDRALEAALPALLAILDVPVEDEQWTRLDPPQRRQRTLDAVKHLLLRESHVQPLVVLFEDLHWIDGETQNVLEKVIESLPTAAMLLLLNYRPEYQHLWGSKTFYRQLRLDALPTASADELLEALLGSDPGLASLKRLLIERTEGNPFFLEESVRALIETKVLTGGWGAYRLTRTPESLQIPPTAQAILAARIDRLFPEDKRLLQAAAVIGKNVSFGLLHAITDLSEHDLRQSLGRLQAAEFLYETVIFPDLEYTFKHALTREVAYSTLLHDQRQRLHALVVEALEQQYADRIGEQTEHLARHAFRGEMWEKALTYLTQAGLRAQQRCGHRAAVAFFDQALSAAEHLPRSQRIIERESDLSQLLHGSLFPLGELRRLGDQLSVTAKLAAETGDHVRLVRASTSEAHWGWVTGQPEKAIKSAERARLLAEATGNDFVKRTSGYFLGQAQHLHGDFARCIEVLTAASKDPETELERPPGPVMADYDLYALAWLAMAHAEFGNFRLAIAAGSEAVERGERRGNTYGLFHGCMGLGIALLLNGDVARAIPPLERGRSIAEAAELPLIRYAIEVHLASAYSLGGRLADGQALLEQAVTYLDSVGFLAFGPFATSQLSELYLRCGRTDDAIRLAHRARDLTLECHQRGYHAWTLRLLGEIDASLQTTAVPEAEGHYFDAMKLGRELGMRPLVAHCHLGLCKLYRRTGKREQAHEHLTTATTMYREMGMTYWLERAEAEQQAQ